MTEEQAAAVRGPRGQVGRASRSPGQLWQVPLFFAGLLLFSVTFITAPSRGDNTARDFQADLTRLRQGLQPGQEKPGVLVAQADNLVARLSQFHRHAGEIHFLAGSAYFRQANQCAPDDLAANQKKAIHHLEEALALGVAAADQAPLRFRLGWTLYHQGKDPKRAIELMAQSVAKGADLPAQGYGVLVQAYLALPKPNLEAALGASEKQLELTDEHNVEDMAAARLARGELLLRKEQRLDAFKELKRVSDAAPRPVRLKARLLQARICEEEALWNLAIPVWQELLKDAADIEGGKARALYALGLAYKNCAPPRQDEALAKWQEAFALGGDYGQAAGIRLGDMKLHYGPKSDAKAALAIWTQALANIHSANDYKIQALDLKRARAILDNACVHFLDNHDYEQTRQVADLYKKIALPGVAEERSAQAAEGLARASQENAKLLPPAKINDKMQEVRLQFQRAALAYEEAAVARADGRPDIYWRSAQCYMAAQDYARAGTVLTKFVLLEKNEGRLAEAWLCLAEAYVALGNKVSAHKAYERCLEFPGTPCASRARYQLAVQEMDDKNYEAANDILAMNLINQGPVQDRAAHKQSIYKMAELTYLMRDFAKATLYFKQAIELYPNHDGIDDARAMLGDSYRKLAESAKEKWLAAKDKTTQDHYRNDRLSWLEQGANAYDRLADALEYKTRHDPLTPSELGLLRNALFTAADLKFEMNDFPEALRRYADLQERYRQKAEGLLACKNVWKCVGFMVTPDQALIVRKALVEALKKFKIDLATMPEDSPAFHGPGASSKKFWETWILWVDEQLNPTARPVRPSPVID